MIISELYVKDLQYILKIPPFFLSFGIPIEGFCSLVLGIITNGLRTVLEIIIFKKLFKNLEHTLELNVLYVHFFNRKPVF